ncbi:MAG: methionine gamma-lyase family protein [Firmicutes bacterium]|nr:methionine gamma-lyase family protein [Bacillota bacterium]
MNNISKTNYANEYLTDNLDIDPAVLSVVEAAEEKVSGRFTELDDIMTFNQYKVLDAFRKNGVSDSHFVSYTGYGYDDPGRTMIEKVFATAFRTESALVRTQIVNGTHAISMALMGVLRRGDEMIAATGLPYDTIQATIGLAENSKGKGTLADYGVTYKQVDLNPDATIDVPGVLSAITPKTRLIHVQRATGYAWRKAILIPEIEAVFRAVKAVRPDIICMTDNCYGEFLDIKEPTEVGADLMAGSLIKNPGGGLALSGGYVVGREDLIDLVARRLYTPGIAGECGLTFNQTRTMLQGFFLGPKVTNGAVKGAILCTQVFQDLGYDVSPKPLDPRSDIIAAVKLGSREAMIAFSKGVQSAAPVDSFVEPVPAPMPGYDDDVIMAAGAFIQGATLELSCDGPMREPYIIYFQGGLTYEHARFGVIMALQKLKEAGLLQHDA